MKKILLFLAKSLAMAAGLTIFYWFFHLVGWKSDFELLETAVQGFVFGLMYNLFMWKLKT